MGAFVNTRVSSVKAATADGSLTCLTIVGICALKSKPFTKQAVWNASTTNNGQLSAEASPGHLII